MLLLEVLLLEVLVLLGGLEVLGGLLLEVVLEVLVLVLVHAP